MSAEEDGTQQHYVSQGSFFSNSCILAKNMAGLT